MNKTKIYKLLFIIMPFILAFPFHFAFDIIPFPLLSIHFPINESIFQHTKLTFTPIIVTYLIFYILFYKKLNKEKLLSNMIISIVISTFSMLGFYYLFKSITGKEIMLLSILSLLIGTCLGQYISSLTYKKDVKWSKEISIYSLLTITLVFLMFTVNPPYLDFFKDMR